MATNQERLKIAKELARAEVLTYLADGRNDSFNSGFVAGLRKAAVALGVDVFSVESDVNRWVRDNCPGLASDCVAGCHACSEWAAKYVPC